MAPSSCMLMFSSVVYGQAGKGGELTHDETTIITGALEMTQKTAKDAMTPISDTFSVDVNAVLDMYGYSFTLKMATVK